MKKKVLIILVLLLVIAGVGGYIFWNKSKTEDKKVVKKDWNPYSTETRHMATIPDYLTSAVKGDYIVKMTVTLEFNDEDGYNKYKGLNEPPVAEEKSATKETSSKEHVVTPMEVQINSLITTYMLNLTEDNIVNKQAVEQGLTKYLNENLKPSSKPNKGEKELFKNVFIESYIVN